MKPRDYIEKFCAPLDEPRTYLTLPTREDGKLHASTGHILIVTDDDLDVPALEGSQLTQHSAKIRAGMPDRDDLYKPLVIDLPEPDLCTYCGGAGRVKICPDCQGSGEMGRDLEECPTCKGSGDLMGVTQPDDPATEECWCCDGSGQVRTQPVQVDTGFFARRYLALIKTLPGLLLCVSPNPKEAAYFRFDGGWGALMPCCGD